jgi:phospholipid/cholesterol/gamma-HCH transport system substrate-binding protein
MKRTGKITWGNMWIGIIVTFAIAVVLYSSFGGGGVSIFSPKKTVVAYFQDVNGLVKGASVRLAGVEVGSVKSVKFVNLDEFRRLEVKLNVKESVWPLITTDSKVQLGTLGLLGDKYIEIFPGTKGLPVVKPGAVLQTAPEVGLDALVRKPPEVTNSIDSILLNLRAVTTQVARNEGSLGRLISDTGLYQKLVTALDRTTEVMTEFSRNQKAIMEKLETTLNNTAEITGRIDRGEGSLGKFISDDSLYDNLSSSSRRLDSILAMIENGKGSAGALINDARLYEEIRDLVTRMNNLVADIEKNPHRYLKFSIF